ncbi:MAG: hypothetical protein ACYTHJ_05825 [Planctomycetota bacterium]
MEMLAQLFDIDPNSSCAEGVVVTAGYPINAVLATTVLPLIQQIAPVVYHRAQPDDGFPMSAQEFYEAMLCGDVTEGRCSASGNLCDSDEACPEEESCIVGGPDSVCHPSNCNPPSSSGYDLIENTCSAGDPFENNDINRNLNGDIPTYFSVTTVKENEIGDIVESVGSGQLRFRHRWF